jgi:hypothetical protein
MKQKKIMRQAPMQKVVGKPAAQPQAGAGIGTIDTATSVKGC